MVDLAEEILTPIVAATPVIDGTYLLMLFLRALHIISAIILVGGLFYIRTVLEPAKANACYAGRRAVWARWVGAASLFLLVSGIYNYMNWINVAKATGEPLDRKYHMLMGIKMLLAIFVMFLAAVLAGKTTLANKFRANMHRWLNAAWICSLAIVILAAILRTFHQ